MSDEDRADLGALAEALSKEGPLSEAVREIRARHIADPRFIQLADGLAALLEHRDEIVEECDFQEFWEKVMGERWQEPPDDGAWPSGSLFPDHDD